VCNVSHITGAENIDLEKYSFIKHDNKITEKL
jgi:hypothetical protein